MVIHDGSDSIRRINQALRPVDDLPRATNPDALAAPKVTAMVTVSDLDTETLHMILIRRVDFRPRPAPAVGNVAVFSEPVFAPCRTETLQLATPGYYREHENLEPGIRDPHDGTLTKDGSIWATTVMGGAVTARLSFASEGEPWVYCASHYRTDSELRRLRDEFGARLRVLGGQRNIEPRRLRGLPWRRLRSWRRQSLRRLLRAARRIRIRTQQLHHEFVGGPPPHRHLRPRLPRPCQLRRVLGHRPQQRRLV